MNNQFLKYEELSPAELNSFDRDRTIFFITLSPLENHGPHLPLGMDILEGEAISEKVAEKFNSEHPDWKIIFCPRVTMGMGLMPGMGSISFKQSTIYNFLIDYLSSLAKKGFKYIFVSGFHAGLRHLVTIDQAIHRVNKKYNAKIVSPFGFCFTNIIAKRRDLPSQEINKIFRDNPGDMHGGMFETSFMLYVRPDLVKEYKSLKDIDVSGINPVKKAIAAKNALKTGYFGFPAKADMKIGEAILNDASQMFYEVLIKAMEDEKFLYSIKSIPYSQPYMRNGFFKKFFTALIFVSGLIAYIKLKDNLNKNRIYES